jgi:hypothetical protein
MPAGVPLSKRRVSFVADGPISFTKRKITPAAKTALSNPTRCAHAQALYTLRQAHPHAQAEAEAEVEAAAAAEAAARGTAHLAPQVAAAP